jgi:hypothetical protein
MQKNLTDAVQPPSQENMVIPETKKCKKRENVCADHNFVIVRTLVKKYFNQSKAPKAESTHKFQI